MNARSTRATLGWAQTTRSRGATATVADVPYTPPWATRATPTASRCSSPTCSAPLRWPPVTGRSLAPPTDVQLAAPRVVSVGTQPDAGPAPAPDRCRARSRVEVPRPRGSSCAGRRGGAVAPVATTTRRTPHEPAGRWRSYATEASGVRGCPLWTRRAADTEVEIRAVERAAATSARRARAVTTPAPSLLPSRQRHHARRNRLTPTTPPTSRPTSCHPPQSPIHPTRSPGPGFAKPGFGVVRHCSGAV